MDSLVGVEDEAQQLTRAARPQGEGVVTDNPRNVTAPESWRASVSKIEPPRAGVHLNGGVFRTAQTNNIAYLLDSFSVDDVLRQFRERAVRRCRDPNTNRIGSGKKR